MALPIIPLALIAGAVTLVHNVHVLPVNQPDEDALDGVTEGLSAYRDKAGQQINSSYRWVRTVRFGRAKTGYEIDLSAIGRIRFKKVS